MTPNLLLALLMLSNFLLVTASRLPRVIQLAAAQGLILGALLLSMRGDLHLHVVAMALGGTLIKAGLIPWMLRRALSRVKIHREVTPYIGFGASLLICAVGTGLSLLIAGSLPTAPRTGHSLFVPGALATLFTGFLVLVSRRTALAQVVGYLVLENGIYVFGLLLARDMPMFVEVGVLLDLFVAIFVMGIVINHIQRTFDSLDTQHLSRLKD